MSYMPVIPFKGNSELRDFLNVCSSETRVGPFHPKNILGYDGKPISVISFMEITGELSIIEHKEKKPIPVDERKWTKTLKSMWKASKKREFGENWKALVRKDTIILIV